MYNQAMSARKSSWFGIAKSFVKAVEKDNKKRAKQRAAPVRTAPKQTEKPSFTISITDDDGKEYVGGMPRMAQNSDYIASIKTHLATLVSFYKQYGAEYITSENENYVVSFIKILFPNADAHTCPYCGVIHDFTATRARKCPDCGNQMIVRQGVFLSTQQVDKLEVTISEYYEKSGVANQLKYNIEQIQSYANDGNYGKAFLMVAEAYQACAVVHNDHDSKGYSKWDYSWRVINGEAFQIAGLSANSGASLIGNGYSDVMYARGMHCLKELKYAKTSGAMNKSAKIAITEFYDYLTALNVTGLTDWHHDDAIKNIHIALALGHVNSADYEDIKSRVHDRAPIKPNQNILSTTFQQVDDYIFLDTDVDRIKMYIY